MQTRIQLTIVGLAMSALLRVASGQVTEIRDATSPPLPPVVTAARPTTVVETLPGQEVTLAGQVLRTKLVDVRGTTEKMLVAMLDLGNGQREIVDLGPAQNFRLVPIQTGEQISVRGPHAALGRYDVLLATGATVAGNDIAIRRAAPTAVAVAAAAPPGYAVVNQVRRIDGRINHMRSARLRDSREEHMMAEVVTRGGQSIVVDLGPPSALWRANLNAGEWITAQGQEMNVNNQPVLLALDVNKDGRTYEIQRNLVTDAPAAVATAPEAVVVPVR